MSYLRMRLLWSWRNLLLLARKWGVYAAALAILFGGSGLGALAVISAIAFWSVYPIIFVVNSNLLTALLASVAHSIIGAGYIYITKSFLRNAHWNDCERALPVSNTTLLTANSVIVAVALTPLVTLYLIGLVTWASQVNAMQIRVHQAFASLALSVLFSCGIGIYLLARSNNKDPRPSSYNIAGKRKTEKIKHPILATFLYVTGPLLIKAEAKESLILLIASAIFQLASIIASSFSLLNSRLIIIILTLQSWVFVTYIALTLQSVTRATIAKNFSLPLSFRNVRICTISVALIPYIFAQAIVANEIIQSPLRTNAGVTFAYFAMALIFYLGLTLKLITRHYTSKNTPNEAYTFIWMLCVTTLCALASEM